MTIKVKIQFRDDSVEEYKCVDFPSIADWICLYFDDMSRSFLPRDAIKKIDVESKR